jgi:hypothetical protein
MCLRPLTRAGFLLGVFAIAVSCGDEQDSFPTATDAAPVFEISDAVHMGGNEDFFFLPPMVPDPSDACDPGEFDGTLQPVVEICQLGLECVVGTQPSGFPIVYSMTDGPGSETVRVNDLVDDLEKNYIVNWHTNEFGLLDRHRGGHCGAGCRESAAASGY